jgi:uncharacterized protein (UPF0212 family)
VFQDRHIREVTVTHERAFCQNLRETEDAIGVVANRIHERLSDSLVDLVYIDPQLVRSLAALVLHRLNETGR